MNINNNEILQIEQLVYSKNNNSFIFNNSINNYPILYFGISTDKSLNINKIYIGESNNFVSRYKKIDFNMNPKNEQLISLVKHTLSKNFDFQGFIVSSPQYFNASATKQLETLFIKLFRAYFGKEIIQNIKIDQNIHFYNNKKDIDYLQKDIFNSIVRNIFNNIKKQQKLNLNYEYVSNLQRNKLNPIIMDNFQNKIVEEMLKTINDSNNYLIKGDAGTGKTLVIVSMWEEMIKNNLKEYLQNNNLFKRIYICSAKKNQLKLLKQYITETIKTFEYTYSSSDFNKISKLKLQNDVLNLYNGNELKNIKDNSVIIVDEAHGLIHTLHKQQTNVYFIHYPIYKQKNNQYPNKKYNDDKNLYNYFIKHKLIFVFDEKQITKQDNISLETLTRLFNIKKNNIKNLNVNYRNQTGIYIYNLFSNGGNLDHDFDHNKFIILDSFEELIKKHEIISKSSNQAKYNRLLSNVSFSWLNKRNNIFKKYIKTNDTNLLKNILEDKDLLILSDVQKKYPYLKIIIPNHKNKLFNTVIEEKWFEEDWFNEDWKNEPWYKELTTEFILRKRKEEKYLNENKKMYYTFGYANSIIGRDLLNSYVYINKDICLFEDSIIPNLDGIVIEWQNNEQENFNKNNWNKYVNTYELIKNIQCTSHIKLNNFFDPSIPIFSSCEKSGLNYFIEMKNYVLKNYFILLSRATNINYVFIEDQEIKNWLIKKIMK